MEKPTASAPAELQGLRGTYLYCVAEGDVDPPFAAAGLEGKEVYAIEYMGLVAIACDCPPSRVEDAARVEKWMIAHQSVVDKAMERFGAVLPFGFGRIIAGDSGGNRVREWLESSHGILKRKLERVRGKAEYGVQVFWDQEIMTRRLMRDNQRIEGLRKEGEEKRGGTAFMHEIKLEKVIKEDLAARANECFRFLYRGVSELCEVKVERVYGSAEGGRMIANISCLLKDTQIKALGEILEKVNDEEGIYVRFTGPWPPYSFV